MVVNYSLIKTNSELKALAREKLKGNWGMAILAAFIMALLTSVFQFIPYIGAIISIIIIGPLTLGMTKFFLRLIRKEELDLEILFEGFKNFERAFLLQILMQIFVFLWALLFIIPGIIAGYRYSMAFCILSDNPEMSAMEALKKSKKMMDGFKWKLFTLQLSFIGWAILCILTCGIGFLWLTPYITTSTMEFYQNLKDAYVEQEVAKATFYFALKYIKISDFS